MVPEQVQYYLQLAQMQQVSVSRFIILDLFIYVMNENELFTMYTFITALVRNFIFWRNFDFDGV